MSRPGSRFLAWMLGIFNMMAIIEAFEQDWRQVMIAVLFSVMLGVLLYRSMKEEDRKAGQEEPTRST